MISDSATMSDAHRRILDRLCARNQSVELHYVHNGVRRTARARLLELRDDVVLLSRPQAIGSAVVLRERTVVNVYVLDHGEMYSFQTRVQRGMIRVRLNAEKTIPGAELVVPARLDRQQRRNRYRVSVARHEIAVTLHEMCDAEHMSTPLGARHFDGQLTNVSGGGFAAVFDLQHARGVDVGVKLFASFQLPESDWYFGLPVEVRHVRRTHDDTRVVVGFAALHLQNPYVYAQMCQVDQFAIDEQRRRIRRKSSGTPMRNPISRLRQRRRGLR